MYKFLIAISFATCGSNLCHVILEHLSEIQSAATIVQESTIRTDANVHANQLLKTIDQSFREIEGKCSRHRTIYS